MTTRLQGSIVATFLACHGGSTRSSRPHMTRTGMSEVIATCVRSMVALNARLSRTLVRNCARACSVRNRS